MSRSPFIFIFFMMMTCYMSGCKSLPANFHQPQVTQADQRLNNVQYGNPAQKSRTLSGEVPFGQGNPLPYSQEIQERILEGVNEMAGDIAAEVINTLEMLEMKKEVQRKHQRRGRSTQHHRLQNSEEYEQKSVK